MTTLSLVLPDTLAKASQFAAKQLGISRTQFIRNAISHEIELLEAKMEQDAIVSAMVAMKHDQNYLNEIQNITTTLNSQLPPDEDGWWNKT